MMKNKMFRRIACAAPILVAAVIACCYAPTGVAATPVDPEDLVREVTLSVTRRLADSAAELEADPDYVKTVVRDLILPHVNFPALTAAIMGEHWNTLSHGEQRCVTTGIRQRLVERYARVLLDYEYSGITTDKLPPLSKAGPVFVTQTITTPNPQPMPVVYNMEQIDGSWKLVDLIVAGVSLVSSYRVSFEEQIEAVGIGDFLRTFDACRER